MSSNLLVKIQNFIISDWLYGLININTRLQKKNDSQWVNALLKKAATLILLLKCNKLLSYNFNFN